MATLRYKIKKNSGEASQTVSGEGYPLPTPLPSPPSAPRPQAPLFAPLPDLVDLPPNITAYIR